MNIETQISEINTLIEQLQEAKKKLQPKEVLSTAEKNFLTELLGKNEKEFTPVEKDFNSAEKEFINNLKKH